MNNLTWTNFKSFVDSRELSVQWIEDDENYWLKALDGYFSVDCRLSKNNQNDDLADFEANYKAAGNLAPQAQVVTQFEKRDKTLKIASGSAAVDTETGIATVYIKVPGTPGSGEGRWLSSGLSFFDQAHPGDRVLGVYFTDEDNLTEGGAGSVIGSYTDDDAEEANRGWYIPSGKGELKAEAIGGYGFAPAGFYVKIIGKKAESHYTGTFYVNMEWGKTDE